MNRKMMATLLLTGALTTVAQTEPNRIDLGQKGTVESPNLYGIFFEEISHAGMTCFVRNGDFEGSDADMDAVIQDFRDAIDYALANSAKNRLFDDAPRSSVSSASSSITSFPPCHSKSCG